MFNTNIVVFKSSLEYIKQIEIEFINFQDLLDLLTNGLIILGEEINYYED